MMALKPTPKHVVYSFNDTCKILIIKHHTGISFLNDQINGQIIFSLLKVRNDTKY